MRTLGRKIIELDPPQGFAAEATAGPLPERKEVLCAPASPSYDERELEELRQMGFPEN